MPVTPPPRRPAVPEKPAPVRSVPSTAAASPRPQDKAISAYLKDVENRYDDLSPEAAELALQRDGAVVFAGSWGDVQAEVLKRWRKDHPVGGPQGRNE